MYVLTVIEKNNYANLFFNTLEELRYTKKILILSAGTKQVNNNVCFHIPTKNGETAEVIKR